MSVIPTAERTRDLNVAKLEAFHVVAVLEFPAHVKRAHAHAQDSAITVANSGRALYYFERLPRRSEAFECAGLRVPAENIFGRTINYGFSGEDVASGHIFLIEFPTRVAK